MADVVIYLWNDELEKHEEAMANEIADSICRVIFGTENVALKSSKANRKKNKTTLQHKRKRSPEAKCVTQRGNVAKHGQTQSAKPAPYKESFAGFKEKR